MTSTAFATFVLTLSCQVVAQEMVYDPLLAVNVTTKSGKVVQVKGPKVNPKPDPDIDYTWNKPVILPSKDERFTAVYYYSSFSKYWDAQVYLVGPDGRV